MLGKDRLKYFLFLPYFVLINMVTRYLVQVDCLLFLKGIFFFGPVLYVIVA